MFQINSEARLPLRQTHSARQRRNRVKIMNGGVKITGAEGSVAQRIRHNVSQAPDADRIW